MCAVAVKISGANPAPVSAALCNHSRARSTLVLLVLTDPISFLHLSHLLFIIMHRASHTGFFSHIE